MVPRSWPEASRAYLDLAMDDVDDTALEKRLTEGALGPLKYLLSQVRV